MYTDDYITQDEERQDLSIYFGAGAYLLHFSTPYKHARHYLGWSSDLGQRIAAHQTGNGARLLQVIRENGIAFQVARLWAGPRSVEQKLKRRHSGVRLCPICKTGGAR